ncbi:YggT family protein [Chitinasiproducens palmae]|uniref:YggT family protein n=1 Tax=Chitinasiproducens palmae TaxID=1770053 RepID=A0A1H2PPJ2_9BURK|nr:YggT family protein [Chitinasiproducens palmae]SDV48647.1 YggT family protein [Chitinasiproducens palmae]
MFGDIALFLLNIVFTLFGAALVLRTWIQAARVPPRNPISQGLFQISDWLVLPLRRVIPGWRGIDWASLVGAWLTALVYLLLMFALIGVDLAALFPAILLNALLVAFKWAVNLVLWATILYALMSWINPTAPAMMMLDMLLAPLLNPLRRILPNLGGFDLSPLALVVLTQLLLIVVARLSAPVIASLV